MSAKMFFFLNALILAVIVIRLLTLKRPKPTTLQFDTQNKDLPVTPFKGPLPASTDERSLNCWFQYNGHTWDAFEVLGVPAGSTREACQRAYHDLQRNYPSNKEFLQEAWHALENSFFKK